MVIAAHLLNQRLEFFGLGDRVCRETRQAIGSRLEPRCKLSLACQDGRVAVAALEPHFARRLGRVAGLGEVSTQDLLAPEAHTRLKGFFASKTRQALDALAEAEDIPLLTLAAASP